MKFKSPIHFSSALKTALETSPEIPPVHPRIRPTPPAPAFCLHRPYKPHLAPPQSHTTSHTSPHYPSPQIPANPPAYRLTTPPQKVPKKKNPRKRKGKTEEPPQNRLPLDFACRKIAPLPLCRPLICPKPSQMAPK